MDRMILNQITPVIEAAIDKFAETEIGLTWWAGVVAMPTPQGMVPQGMVILTMPSPILGGHPLVGGGQVPSLNALLDQDVAERVVSGLVGHLRQAKAEALSVGGNGQAHL